MTDPSIKIHFLGRLIEKSIVLVGALLKKSISVILQYDASKNSRNSRMPVRETLFARLTTREKEYNRT